MHSELHNYTCRMEVYVGPGETAILAGLAKDEWPYAESSELLALNPEK